MEGEERGRRSRPLSSPYLLLSNRGGRYLGADLGFKVYNQSEKTYILFNQIFIPFSITNWWFVTVYILLVIIAPLLNSLVSGLSKRRFVIVIILFWLLAYTPQLIYDGPFSPVVRAVLFYLINSSSNRVS